MENKKYKTVYYIEKICDNCCESEFLEVDLIFNNDNQAVEYFRQKYSTNTKARYILYRTILNIKLDDDIIAMQILKEISL